MRSSILRLLGLAALLVAAAVGFVVAGSGLAQAHPGHGHDHPGHAHAGSVQAVHLQAVHLQAGDALTAHGPARQPVATSPRVDVRISAATVDGTPQAVALAPQARVHTSDSSAAAAIDGSVQHDGSASGGCAAPGCCGGGPCSVCCSVVPAHAGLVWPSRAAAVLGIHPGPTLDDAMSSGLIRPPRFFV
ncbi:hypothetical protein CCR97_20925 [Rhodoplanes elegans]|uniref:Uncharacterized protein n=2 Tax=Rhodoplanes elegans TaxID=29408 RepID=A0A327KKD1_9BRAD|nr:hypothetical protein [Rhodoplanes elegans]RAI38967.1 hypothetical protein CH338_10945 [Rhodoplanes elegans]